MSRSCRAGKDGNNNGVGSRCAGTTVTTPRTAARLRMRCERSLQRYRYTSPLCCPAHPFSFSFLFF